jgi:hypothetical protein
MNQHQIDNGLAQNLPHGGGTIQYTGNDEWDHWGGSGHGAWGGTTTTEKILNRIDKGIQDLEKMREIVVAERDRLDELKNRKNEE